MNRCRKESDITTKSLNKTPFLWLSFLQNTKVTEIDACTTPIEIFEDKRARNEKECMAETSQIIGNF